MERVREDMRKTLTIIGLLVALLCIACNSDTQLPTGDGYSVRSDVESISGVSVQSRGYAEEGDPIIGVLLKFDGDDEFYIEYLNGDIRENGDGMKFNYILHVPEEIDAVYAAAGGDNPKSGNPFWWYMSCYFGLSKKEIENDYDKALGLLLSSQGQTLPTAKVEDFDASWPKSGEFVEQDDKTVDDGTLVLIDPEPESKAGGLWVDSQSTGPFVTVEGYGDIIRRAFYITPGGKLYYPMELVDVYCDYKGEDYKYNGSGDPLWKYMETYFDVSLYDARKDMNTAVLQRLRENQESLPYPSVEDYIADDSEPDDPLDLSDYEEFFDKEDYDKLAVDIPDVSFADIEDISFVPQLSSENAYVPEKREYCWTTFSYRVKNDRLKLYYPMALTQAYYEYTGEYTDSGNPLWTYMKCYFPESQLGDIDYVKQVGYVEVLNFIVEHRDEMPFPDAEYYVEVLGPLN